MNRNTLLFIPMYNCENQISRVIEKIKGLGIDQNLFSQILILDNRSTDSSIDIAKKSLGNLSIPAVIGKNQQNNSIGGSHKIAFIYAIKHRFKSVVVLHGDDQGDIRDIIPYLKDDRVFAYDSYLGSRFLKESRLINYSKFRIIGNVFFNRLISGIIHQPVKDLGSGLNYFSVNYLKNSKRFYMRFPNTMNFEFYMLMYGIYSKSKFAFFPLSWREDDQVSNAKMVSQAIDILHLTFQYKKSNGAILKKTTEEIKNANYKTDIVFENKAYKEKMDCGRE